MYKAFQFAKKNHSTETVIIGTDSPTLPLDFITEAFQCLQTHDVVVGPTVDGGYYLIGLKEPVLSIFQNVAWSSSNVLRTTLQNAQKAKKKIYLLPQWYDVDDRNSLEHLLRDLKKKGNAPSALETKKELKELEIFKKVILAKEER